MASVVSGQTVVHSESTNPITTALPRNCWSDMGWPNWLVSFTLGAGVRPSDVPWSRLGLAAAALELGDAADDEPVPDPPRWRSRPARGPP